MSTAEQVQAPAAIRANLTDFLEAQTKQPVAADLDLFGSGLVSSLFALQLVVHVETAFGIAVQAADLKLDNFRSVDAITDLVLRQRA